jgi:murein DD-endopeptidase MepM/ murein hydrolase activator NlpD
LYQWREWQVAGGGAVAAPRGFGRAAPARPPFRLAVDLADDIFSKTWWRGAISLAAMCGGLGLLAPSPEPLLAVPFDQVSASEAEAIGEIGIAPSRLGGRSGGRMAPSAAVETLLNAPERAQVSRNVRFGAGDRLGPLLARLGARLSDAARVEAMVAGAARQGIEPGTPVAVTLGRKDSGGLRPIARVALRAGLSLELVIAADASGKLTASASRLAVDSTPRRIRGRVGDGLYWSLRSAGVEPATAADYLKALATQIEVGSALTPDDRFDLVVANRRSASGENIVGGLLYAGVTQSGARSIELLKWSVGGKPGWYDAASLKPVSTGFAWPVSAPITSNFGMRYHPILHFARMHRGIDFGARWGAPILASADGQGTRAGWAGGYGRQVRIAHGGGVASSYSHMSRMVVEPGSLVRQGQLIGYVGTSGLSTGPHLHYETYRGGVAVDPRSVRFAGTASANPAELARFKARLAQLLGTARS